jgi:hypothetical protein
MKRRKENKNGEGTKNEINRGPNKKNQTHKIKEEIKLVGNIRVINKRKQKNKRYTLVVAEKNRKT